MEIVPVVQSLGLPVALSVYLLWQQSRLAAEARAEHEKVTQRLERVQQAALDRERVFAEAFARVAKTMSNVVARNNEAIEALRNHLESDAARADTETLKALRPVQLGDSPFPFPAASHHSEHPHG